VPEPTVTETVTLEPEPQQETTSLETGEPTEVRLSDDDRALVGLAACLLALGVGARIVGSF
jgi:hypothetical protein